MRRTLLDRSCVVGTSSLLCIHRRFSGSNVLTGLLIAVGGRGEGDGFG